MVAATDYTLEQVLYHDYLSEILLPGIYSLDVYSFHVVPFPAMLISNTSLTLCTSF